MVDLFSKIMSAILSVLVLLGFNFGVSENVSVEAAQMTVELQGNIVSVYLGYSQNEDLWSEPVLFGNTNPTLSKHEVKNTDFIDLFFKKNICETYVYKLSNEGYLTISAIYTDKDGNKTQSTKSITYGEPQAPEIPSLSTVTSRVLLYNTVYNKSKREDDLRGVGKVEINSITVDGNVNNSVTKVVNTIFEDTESDLPLPPFSDSNKGLKSSLKKEDIRSSSWQYNDDGTLTLTLYPKKVTNSERFEDSQGKLFNVADSVNGQKFIDEISSVGFYQGNYESNATRIADGGYCEIRFDIYSKSIITAKYVLKEKINLKHTNILTMKDKTFAVDYTYTMSYPC